MLNVTKDNFNKEVAEAKGLVVIDLWAPWCGPCRMLAPTLDELASEYPEVKFCKVNVDEEPELAAQYQVVSIPTLFVIKDGQVVNQSLGARPKPQILEML